MRSWCLWTLVAGLLVSRAFGACPNKCSGHGKCGLNDVCDCMQNWIGGDCANRLCPFTRAWVDTAAGTDDAHYYAECSNRGVCDRDKGVCDCDAGFTGSGCRRMTCPDECNGHGTCEFIEEMAQDSFDKRINGVQGRKYSLWDQEKIMGCKCDPGYEGHNCAKRICPKGDDPLTQGQYDMMQAIAISPANSAAVEGYLTYFDQYGNAFTTDTITFALPASAADTCDAIQTALRRLPNNVLNTVTVEQVYGFYPFERTSPKSTGGTIGTEIPSGYDPTSPVLDISVCAVTFPSEPGTTGYQNLLECNLDPHDTTGQHPVSAGNTADDTVACAVYEIYPATTVQTAGPAERPLSESAECSGRGYCDSTTGTCKCFAGHMGLACEKQEALV